MCLPLIPPTEPAAEQRSVYLDMRNGVGKAIRDLTLAMTADASLPDKVRQIAILVGARYNAAYELYAHAARRVTDARAGQGARHQRGRRRRERDAEGDRLADFERGCRSDVRMLQEAFDRDDLCTLMEAAYSIAGASRMAGAIRLACACDAIEYAGRAQFALIDAGVATEEPLGAPARQAYRLFQRELACLRLDL